ncbi:hypothetical protein BT96DRAFT_1089330 [Gymnopus androsaceus JB14]|uniref:Uncharacterized protein n=1 Tax=Gymnopus androsaceus JB14 TaxID=1447944 RepID=A0A6A4GJM1_9AGAR|nr:hypothetical protein BT96DRAFT_1089330 [Gymnopus androsaceus JB14]
MFLAQTCVEFCEHHKEKASWAARLNTILLVATSFAFGLQATFNDLVNSICLFDEENLFNLDDEAQAKHQDELNDKEFVVTEMLKITNSLDYGDILVHNYLPEELVAPSMELLSCLTDSERDLICVVAIEVIQVLWDPGDDEDDVASLLQDPDMSLDSMPNSTPAKLKEAPKTCEEMSYASIDVVCVFASPCWSAWVVLPALLLEKVKLREIPKRAKPSTFLLFDTLISPLPTMMIQMTMLQVAMMGLNKQAARKPVVDIINISSDSNEGDEEEDTPRDTWPRPSVALNVKQEAEDEEDKQPSYWAVYFLLIIVIVLELIIEQHGIHGVVIPLWKACKTNPNMEDMGWVFHDGERGKVFQHGEHGTIFPSWSNNTTPGLNALVKAIPSMMSGFDSNMRMRASGFCDNLVGAKTKHFQKTQQAQIV